MLAFTKIHKPYVFILLCCAAGFPLLLSSCFKERGEDDCSWITYCPDKEGDRYDTLSLSDANKNWLSFAKTYRNVRFKQQDSAVTPYPTSIDCSVFRTTEHNKTYLPRVNRGAEGCCRNVYYNDYHFPESEVVTYRTAEGLELYLTRKIGNAERGPNKTLVAKPEDEFLELLFDISLKVHPGNTSQSEDQVYHPTINLGGKAYSSVYEILSGQNTNAIFAGYYFSKSKGLIGFYIKQGTLWLLDDPASKSFQLWEKTVDDL